MTTRNGCLSGGHVFSVRVQARAAKRATISVPTTASTMKFRLIFHLPGARGYRPIWVALCLSAPRAATSSTFRFAVLGATVLLGRQYGHGSKYGRPAIASVAVRASRIRRPVVGRPAGPDKGSRRGHGVAEFMMAITRRQPPPSPCCRRESGFRLRRATFVATSTCVSSRRHIHVPERFCKPLFDRYKKQSVIEASDSCRSSAAESPSLAGSRVMVGFGAE